MARSLQRTDLNLLMALRVLLEERNVTHAARRLFVSQPALSKTLQRLREEFNDPLFTRAAFGLVPTPRALELEKVLPQLLDELENLIHPGQFDPAAYKGSFRIAVGQSMAHLLVVPLVRQLITEAPKIQLQSMEVDTQFLEQLASGELDFAIHLHRPYGNDYVSTPLVSFKPSCLMRQDHPLAGKKTISLKEYLHFPHVRLYLVNITAKDIGVVDELLARKGKARRIVWETPYVGPALEVLVNSDCLLVAPKDILEQAMQDWEITIRPLPSAVDFPVVELSLVQHRRTLSSSAHQWLGQQIIQLAQVTPIG